jgi:endoglucanase Acf2
MKIRRSAALLGALVFGGIASAQTVVPAGAGSYYASVPAGQEVPSNSDGAAVSPRVVPGFTGPVQTNEWWSSLIYPRYAGNSLGQPMQPHPLAAQAASDGVRIGYVASPTLRDTGYGYLFTDSKQALTIGVQGLNATEVRVVSASDWTVTARLADASRSIDFTLGHGLPIVYATVSGGNARVGFRSAAGTASVFSNQGNIIGVTIGGQAYALCAPAGSTWSVTSTQATSSLAGKNYFSVALLPAATTAAVNLAAAHAFVFVTGGTVSWEYKPQPSTIDATFNFQTQVKEGTETRPLVALYRHQWLNSTQATETGTFATSRGQMKLARANAFTVSYPYRGILPELPSSTGVDQTTLYNLVNQAYQESNLNGASDTYGSGKNYGRVGQLLILADQVGHTAAKARFLGFLKDQLGDWFSVGSGPNSGNSAFAPVQAESFTEGSGVVVGPSDTGQAALDWGGTDYFKLSNVSFGTGVPNRLTVRFASGSSGSGSIQVRLDSLTGPVIAGGGIGGTGGINNWVEGYFGMNSAGLAALSGNNGVHDLYVICSTPYAGELARIDWIRFDQPGSGGADRAFAYRANWNTLLGNPGSFGLAGEMNDHHFHYGYFVQAAAIVAKYDPAWAASFAPMIELIIKDFANWDRSDTRFPVLRNFDPYAGHSWAAGHAGFAAGNNQESSSEAMNAASGVALWGAVTGNNTLRDLGMYLFAAEEASIQQYWFDADDAVFPAGVTRPVAGIVWSDSMDYATWFTADPAKIHGINFLPITPASLYLGHKRQSMIDNWNLLLSQTGGNPTSWQSINWSALATADPAQALTRLTATPNYQVEEGDSRARTYHWIRTLATFGPVNASITADTPHYAVFEQSGVRRYVAWNPTGQTLTVHFSDGFTLCVPAGETAVGQTGDPITTCGCPADFNADNFVDDTDFVIFANAYNLLACGDPAMPVGCPADLTGDAFVDDADFVLFASAYNALVCA